ncbi:hypothetical protein CRENBAI_008049 [Crenichthys baileyi]|uniref:Uncharacterized protein n=1 Tax=Crenichthys baileyi TaxID=28760 RepID=A0AAV9SLH8_9TELE
MGLVSWSLNAIDKIFSARRRGGGEPSCPDGTFFSRNAMDSWQKWRIVFLLLMSVKDVVDMYTIGCLKLGFLLFGVSGYLAYREIRRMSAAVLAIVIFRAISTQTKMLHELNRRLDVILQDRRQVAVPGLRGEMG